MNDRAFKLFIRESSHRSYLWELLCDYDSAEQAFKDYFLLTQNPKSYEYVALEYNGTTIAFFAADGYYGLGS